MWRVHQAQTTTPKKETMPNVSAVKSDPRDERHFEGHNRIHLHLDELSSIGSMSRRRPTTKSHRRAHRPSPAHRTKH